jgi:hypothetical protein
MTRRETITNKIFDRLAMFIFGIVLGVLIMCIVVCFLVMPGEIYLVSGSMLAFWAIVRVINIL